MKKWQFISLVLALCLICSVFAFLNKETLVGKNEQTTEQTDTVVGTDEGSTAPESTEPEPVPATWAKLENVESYSLSENGETYSGVKISFAANTLYRVVFDNSISEGEEFYVDTKGLTYDSVSDTFNFGKDVWLSSSYSSDDFYMDDLRFYSEDTDYYIYRSGEGNLVNSGEFLIEVYELQGDLDSLEYTSCNVTSGHIDFDYFAVAWPNYTLKLVKFELPEGMNFDPETDINIGDDNSANCGCGSYTTAFLLEYDSENNIVYAAFDYTECTCNYVNISGFDSSAHQVKVSCVNLGTLDITE